MNLVKHLISKLETCAHLDCFVNFHSFSPSWVSHTYHISPGITNPVDMQSRGPAARSAGSLPALQLRVRLLWIRHGLSCANVLNACSVKEDNVAEARTAKNR